MGRDREDLTRQICNGWKCDLTVASIVLHPDVGEACARLRRWPGARIGQDNVIWKPPGTKPLGFHQDDSYNGWIEPGERIPAGSRSMTQRHSRERSSTCVDRTNGRYRPRSSSSTPRRSVERPLPRAAAAGVTDYEILPIEVPAGSCVIHHGRTWHGSRDNRVTGRAALVIAHCISSPPAFIQRRSATSTRATSGRTRWIWMKATFPSCGARMVTGPLGLTATSR